MGGLKVKVNVDDILFIYEKQVSINTKNKPIFFFISSPSHSIYQILDIILKIIFIQITNNIF